MGTRPGGRAARRPGATGSLLVRPTGDCCGSAFGRLPHGGAEANDVAIRVDNSAFVLAPFRVLRWVHLDTCGAPRRRQGVGVINEEVRRADAAVLVGDHTKVDLNP